MKKPLPRYADPDTVPVLEFQRRLHDMITPKAKAVDRASFVALLVGGMVFFYQMSEMLVKHADWSYLTQPIGVGEAMRAFAAGLAAIAGALGLNIQRFLKGFRQDE
jgi:protein-S-isoprenylcysteine O-methyltransferase Ste14